MAVAHTTGEPMWHWEARGEIGIRWRPRRRSTRTAAPSTTFNHRADAETFREEDAW